MIIQMSRYVLGHGNVIDFTDPSSFRLNAFWRCSVVRPWFMRTMCAAMQFVYITYHTRSLMLASVGMFISAISYPIALLLYRGVFRVRPPCFCACFSAQVYGHHSGIAIA